MDKYTKRDSTGSVDVAASANAYAAALTLWVSENEVGTDHIEEAVEAVFDRFEGKRIPMPALVNLTVLEMGPAPEQHRSLSARVHAYISGQSASNTGRLDIGRGKGGGVARLAVPGAEVPTRPVKKSA